MGIMKKAAKHVFEFFKDIGDEVSDDFHKNMPVPMKPVKPRRLDDNTYYRRPQKRLTDKNSLLPAKYQSKHIVNSRNGSIIMPIEEEDMLIDDTPVELIPEVLEVINSNNFSKEDIVFLKKELINSLELRTTIEAVRRFRKGSSKHAYKRAVELNALGRFFDRLK